MGQYGNQPDFGTRAMGIIPVGNQNFLPENLQKLNSAALYIGTGGTLVCKVVGGNYYQNQGTAEYTVFKNIPNGTFFPVVVDYVYIDDDDAVITTCSDIVALY
jgi:hypothetical protein